MGKGIDGYLLAEFNLERQEIGRYSPLALAYIGDGVYDLVIRTIVVGEANTSANRLHRRTSSMVKASAQAAMIESLMESLDEEELSVYRRGKNAHSPTVAKNATLSDYHKATGFEALMGYLYLTDRFERMVELVKLGLARTGLWEKGRTEECAGRSHGKTGVGAKKETNHGGTPERIIAD